MSKVLRWKDVEHMNLLELAKKYVPVTYTVYIQLARDARERELRKKAVEHYGKYEGCTFFANGIIGTKHFEVCSLEPPRPSPLPPCEP